MRAALLGVRAVLLGVRAVLLGVRAVLLGVLALAPAEGGRTSGLLSVMLFGVRLRVARHTNRLEEMVAFYRDRVGLVETGGFVDHAGYDGVFLGVPGTSAELELTTGGSLDGPPPPPESLLVLYFETGAELDAVAKRCEGAEVVPENPYWRTHARAFADPDGFQVLLVQRR